MRVSVRAAGTGTTKKKGESGATWWRVVCVYVRTRRWGAYLVRRKHKVKKQLSSSMEEDGSDEP